MDECWNEMAIYISEIAREVFGETKGNDTIDTLGGEVRRYREL